MTPRQTLKLLLPLFIILTASFTMRAANNGVGVTLVNYTLDTANNQVNLGYTITINAQVTNFDSTSFNGIINFGLHNDQQVLSNTSIFDKPPYSGDSISLAGHETVPAIFSININHPYFRPGPDVVVVWPISSQPIADSIIIHLDILAPNGITDQKEIPFTYIVVNNTILLKYFDSKITFKQVRIFNNIGQILQELKSDIISSIPLSQLPQGIYFAELTATDGRKTTVKFLAAAER